RATPVTRTTFGTSAAARRAEAACATLLSGGRPLRAGFPRGARAALRGSPDAAFARPVPPFRRFVESPATFASALLRVCRPSHQLARDYVPFSPLPTIDRSREIDRSWTGEAHRVAGRLRHRRPGVAWPRRTWRGPSARCPRRHASAAPCEASCWCLRRM